MSLLRLLLRNLLYHWRGNSAVLLGVAVGTSVLTGALLVGDSLRGSLRDLALEQLGWVDHALVGGRFIREELAGSLGAERVSPAIFLQGAATSGRDDGSEAIVHRAGRVSILGVDERFWLGGQASLGPSMHEQSLVLTPGGIEFWRSTTAEVVLNAALAGELGVGPGDSVTLHLQKVSAIPRESLLGQRGVGDVVDELPLRVRAVISDQGPGRFSLHPSVSLPRNAYVPLALLQNRLHQEGRINALLVAGRDTANLQENLKLHLTLDDWGLILSTPESRTQALFAKLDRNHDGKLTRSEWRRRVAETFAQQVDQNHDGVLDRNEVSAFYREQRSYLSLESRQMLLDPAVADSGLAAAKASGLRSAPTLVYLANSISSNAEEMAAVVAAVDPAPLAELRLPLADAFRTPYSIVTALDASEKPPLGPFLPAGVKTLGEGEIVLADWKESPLHAARGQTITLTYFLPEDEGRLRETSTGFRLRGLVPMTGAADDPDLTPEFPGITDKLDIRDWNPPFPYYNKRVQPRDDRYWEMYRTTPKAYISLADGERLWRSRFGQLTSIRLALPTEKQDQAALDRAAIDFRQRLLERLKPEDGGLVFDPVRERGLQGSAGSTDFGGLFVGFSFFLIVSALLLVGLLFRLNLDRRAGELGLLVATGYPHKTVRRLLLSEGGILAAVGGLIGLAGALVYAWFMLDFLRTRWPGPLDRSFLRLHVTAQSLAIGYAAALLASIATIAWAVRMLARVSPRALLAGETADDRQIAPGGRQPRRSLWIAVGGGAGALLCIILGSVLHEQEAQAMTFFGSGALLLVASLALTWAWMRSARHARVAGHGNPALARLGARNAARHPARSLLTAGLLASATFLIVAVDSFYRDPGKDFLDMHSGSGGFALLGEADLPIYQDLNSARGQDQLNFPDTARNTLQGVSIYPFRLQTGDDVSCLNLYQPRRPRLLGVPERLIRRGGFRFQASEATSPEETADPWLLLDKPRDDGAIPVFGEANTVEWILHKKLGDELDVPNEQGDPVRLRIVGLLQDSVFQSELLLSEKNFLALYPRQEGYQFFLIEAPKEEMRPVRSLLETALADHGFTVTPAAERLEAYLAVENTYLSTFQALGGLGLLLGALGLAVVLLRTAWERRGELALLRALGFRQTALSWLVLAENSFLLVLGLLAGTLTALVAVAPHLLGTSGDVAWLRLLGLLGLVFVVGLTAGAVAVATTLRAPILAALRRE